MNPGPRTSVPAREGETVRVWQERGARQDKLLQVRGREAWSAGQGPAFAPSPYRREQRRGRPCFTTLMASLGWSLGEAATAMPMRTQHTTACPAILEKQLRRPAASHVTVAVPGGFKGLRSPVVTAVRVVAAGTARGALCVRQRPLISGPPVDLELSKGHFNWSW